MRRGLPLVVTIALLFAAGFGLRAQVPPQTKAQTQTQSQAKPATPPAPESK